VYDWLKWRGNFLRASFDSQIVGSNVCSALADAEKQQGEIKHLHVIGVSVGAFAADSCIKIFNKVSFFTSCPSVISEILKNFNLNEESPINTLWRVASIAYNESVILFASGVTPTARDSSNASRSFHQ
jgi:hypothetical protein